MLHIWYRVFDISELRRARALLRGGSARIIVDVIAPGAEAELKREPLPKDGLFVHRTSLSVENAAGCNIRARAEELGATLVRRAAGDIADYCWLGPALRSQSAEWLRLCGSHYYDIGQPLISFLAFLENAYLTGAVEAPDELIIDLGRHDAAAAFAEHAAALLKLSFRLRVVGLSSSAPLAIIRRIARNLLQFGRLAFRQLWPDKPIEKMIAAGGRGIVLVGYERGMIDRLPLGGTIDWYEDSGLPPERVVFCFDRINDRPTDEVRAQLRARGFGWVDFGSIPALDPQAFRSMARSMGRTLRMLPALRSRADMRRWTLLAQYLPMVEWHRAFLRTNQVIAFYQGGQFVPFQMAMNLACRLEDVAIVWSFWSVFALLEQSCPHAIADLIMAIGGFDLGYANAVSFDYRYAAKVGLLTYDGLELGDAERAAELRVKLGASPRFVVAIFDSAHEERTIHHSTERCAEFYRIVLALIRSNPEWGCLIKSKSTAYEDLPPQKGLQDVIEALEAEGRCLRLPNATKPSLVARAADATVCFSINSAGFFSYLCAHRPTLHLDINHLHMHPISVTAGEGEIIFRDPKSFARALLAIEAGDSSYGDIEPWAHLLDPFGDGVGRKRAAALMRSYIEARDQGHSCDAALRIAVSSYAAIYGTDFVTTRMSAHSSLGDSLWQEVKRLYYPDWPPDYPYSIEAESTARIPE